jgi:hypothetical protein
MDQTRKITETADWIEVNEVTCSYMVSYTLHVYKILTVPLHDELKTQCNTNNKLGKQ